MPPRVLVLFNGEERLAGGRAEDGLAVESVRDSARAALESCRAKGYEAEMLAAPEDPAWLVEALGAARPEVVLNLVESLAGEARFEAAVAWLFEMLGIEYTGSEPTTLALCLDKALAKDLLAARGVPVPRGALLTSGDEPIVLAPGKWIVKPSREDASHGIGTGSVVEGEAAARELAREIAASYRQPALVEEFVGGREVNAAILEEDGVPRVLPLAEIDFGRFPPGAPRLVTYAAKWDPASPDWEYTHAVPLEGIAATERAEIERVALAAWRALGLRDYGRVDLRIDERRGPVVLEVNPNPDISPGAGFANTALRAGIGHDDLVGRILAGAFRRRARRGGSGDTARSGGR